MATKVEISVVVPVYNEERSISGLIADLKRVMKASGYGHEIIVVDDGSTDGSKKILEGIDGIKVVEHGENRGYGAALKSGIMKSAGEWILIIDADGTYSSDDIPKLLGHFRKYDMMIGARIGEKVRIPLSRRPIKGFFNMFAGYLTGKDIPDLNSGLRLFRRDIVEKYWKLFPDKFSFTSTLTMLAMTNDHGVKFIPINYHKRVGSSTIHPIKDTMRFFAQLVRLTLYFNPLKVFAPISAVLLFLALVRGIRDFIVTDSIGNLALILFFMGVQALFFGLLADIINKRT
ncbi:MAG: glycosyltransferase family 2 protein [Candidatus Altiarchaeota archaeon]|nr:glycosyltransferase family 2 protein [Candidatus Altiarchaeota archaeon]